MYMNSEVARSNLRSCRRKVINMLGDDMGGA